MAVFTADRVKETTTTTGTGTLNLDGAATNYQTFVAGIGTAKQCYYAIVHQSASEWEVGIGTVTDATPDTLSRDTILSSTNSNNAVNFSAGTKDVFVTSPAYLSNRSIPNFSFYQNIPINMVGSFILNKNGASFAGTRGVGSSLWLQRFSIPAQMNLSEVDNIMMMTFSATNAGGGTLSRAMGIYSFGNNTSLASLLSFSSTSSWNSGTITAGTSTSLTQFQVGWGTTGAGANSSAIMQPMTFASSTLAAGEYVYAHWMDISQATSTGVMGLILHGALLANSSAVQVPNTINSTSAAVLSSNNAISFGSVHFLSHTNVTGGKTIGASATNGALSGLSSAITMTMVTNFTSGSYLTANNTASVLNSVALASAAQSLLSVGGIGVFYVGTGSTFASTAAAMPNFFIGGLMSTASIPATIGLTDTALTYTGITAQRQPWFALVGA